MAERSEEPAPRREGEEATKISATKARQGEIILGKRGIWIWAAAFAAIILLVLLTSFAGP